MTNQKWLYGIIGFLLGIVLTWLFINNNYYRGYGMMGMMGYGRNYGDNNITPQYSGIDAHFIEEMIPHHEDAITMAKLAEAKAEHQEIKTLAASILKTQSAEIEQMKSWYQDWFGKAVPEEDEEFEGRGMMGGRMRMGMMGDDGDIENLETAENFDKEFIEEMIPHHQMAVMMASMLKNSTSRPEMKQLAQDIIKAQTAEIDQMREWYRDWGY